VFHDSREFAFTPALESSWQEIRREYVAVRAGLVEWHERKLYDKGWKVFGLYSFPDGERIGGNIERCPITAELIERSVPGHGAVGFSVLEPRTHIQPHEGYAGAFLRAHLGLIVPVGDCLLKVGGESRPWREGEVMVFDDRIVHQAWNRSDHERVVLLVDFRPELLRIKAPSAAPART
jgi:ornithine lipid ester-linked acyl 2-hydroxylase